MNIILIWNGAQLYRIEHRSGKKGQFLTDSQDTRHKDSVPGLELISLSPSEESHGQEAYLKTYPQKDETTMLRRRMPTFSTLLCQTSKWSSDPLSSLVS